MNASFLFLSAAVALGADAPPPAPAVAAPAVVAAPAPVVVSGAGCGGCGAPAVAVWAAPVSACDPCAPRVGLFDRLRAKWAARPRLFGSNNACTPACVAAPVACAPAPVACAPAPVACGQPVFTGFTTSCPDPCERVGLLARLRARFAGGRSCDAVAAPLASACCGSSVAALPVPGCTSSFGTVLTAPGAGGPVVTGPTTVAPDKMPSPVPPTEPKKDEPKKDEPKKELSIQVPPLSVPSVDVPRVPSLGGTSGRY